MGNPWSMGLSIKRSNFFDCKNYGRDMIAHQEPGVQSKRIHAHFAFDKGIFPTHLFPLQSLYVSTKNANS